MRIYYASMTGNVRRFLRRAGVECTEISEGDASELFVLVTYTFGFGVVPQEVATWLTSNHSYMVGVAASGNRNWGDNFAKAGDYLANKYNVPLLLKFEQAGNEKDITHFIERVRALEENLLRT